MRTDAIMVGRSSARLVPSILIPAVVVMIVVGVLLLAQGYPVEVPPCPPLSYATTYEDPLCNATMLDHTGPLALGRLWWPATWNGTPDPATGVGFERASDHLNIPATSSLRVTIQDRDGNLNLTGGDIVESWSPNGCGGYLALYTGPNSTSLVQFQGLMMQTGYQAVCGSSAPDLVTPFVIGALLVAAVAVPPVVVFRLWRRSPRR